MLQRLGHLNDDVDRVDLVVALVLDDVVVHRPTFHILHHEVVVVAGLTNIERLHDVRMVQRGGRATLGVETLDKLRVIRELPRQHLDRHLAIQRELLGLEDRRHRTLAQIAQHLVPGNLLPAALRLRLRLDALQLATRDEVVLHQQQRQRLAVAIQRGRPRLLQTRLHLFGRGQTLIDHDLPDDRVDVGAALGLSLRRPAIQAALVVQTARDFLATAAPTASTVASCGGVLLFSLQPDVRPRIALGIRPRVGIHRRGLTEIGLAGFLAHQSSTCACVRPNNGACKTTQGR